MNAHFKPPEPAPRPRKSFWDRIGPNDDVKTGMYWPLGIFSKIYVAVLLFGLVATVLFLSDPEVNAEQKRLHPHAPGCKDAFDRSLEGIGANLKAMVPDKAKPGEPLAIPPVEPRNDC